MAAASSTTCDRVRDRGGPEWRHNDHGHPRRGGRAGHRGDGRRRDRGHRGRLELRAERSQDAARDRQVARGLRGAASPADVRRGHHVGRRLRLDVVATGGTAAGPRPKREESEMSLPQVVPPAEWQIARDTLLAKEKEATRARDAGRGAPPAADGANRQGLPLRGSGGEATLVDLFDERRQWIVYHFMFEPRETQPCGGCSMFTDNIGHLAHCTPATRHWSRRPGRRRRRSRRSGSAWAGRCRGSPQPVATSTTISGSRSASASASSSATATASFAPASRTVAASRRSAASGRSST